MRNGNAVESGPGTFEGTFEGPLSGYELRANFASPTPEIAASAASKRAR